MIINIYDYVTIHDIRTLRTTATPEISVLSRFDTILLTQSILVASAMSIRCSIATWVTTGRFWMGAGLSYLSCDYYVPSCRLVRYWEHNSILIKLKLFEHFFIIYEFNIKYIKNNLAKDSFQ